jgi:predicted esterase
MRLDDFPNCHFVSFLPSELTPGHRRMFARSRQPSDDAIGTPGKALLGATLPGRR